MAITPTQEAAYALDYNIARSDLPMAAQLEYDRLLGEGYKTAEGRAGLAAEIAAAKGRFLPLRKRAGRSLKLLQRVTVSTLSPSKKAKGRRLASSVLRAGLTTGRWCSRMAILDTLLSIEEKLEALVPRDGASA